MTQSQAMISVAEARTLLIKNIRPLPAVECGLQEASGRILAAPVISAIDVPPFDNSAMDGYALAFQSGIGSYRLSGIARAGDNPGPVEAGTAVRIFTGAPMPEGCDTVVQQEIVSNDGTYIHFAPESIKAGMNVRYRGSQNRCGDQVASAGSLLTPGLIGLIASVGVEKLRIFPAPSVGILVTGDELQAVGESLRPGHIYNSNLPTLISYLSLLGLKDYQSLTAGDVREEVEQALESLLDAHDVLLISGGISVGEFDFVHEGLRTLGTETLFYKLRQKPGKPFFAGKKGDKWVFALPGNPASVISCFNQFVKPSLLTLMGHRNCFEADGEAVLTHSWTKKAGMTHFLKGHSENGKVSLLDGQESFNLLAFNSANCFVEIPEESSFLEAGSTVKIWRW